jgi:4-hydroxy-2-oxoheptanedioate aldolase
VWCADASPGMVARLARLGFDWLCLDAQHGMYSRSEIIDVARNFPTDAAELVVRVVACDFAAIGAALDAGARAVIVPQIESAAEAQRAVAATFYPPAGGRSLGQLGSLWGGATMTAEATNRSTSCAVMIESADGLAEVEEIAAVDGVDQLFIGPHDLSLSLDTTVQALVDDDSESSPLTRIVRAGVAYGRTVGSFAGTPDLAERFRERGISCVAVATDSWITSEGARAALR